MPSDVSLFILDDQPLFRLGLRRALEQAGGFALLGDSAPSSAAVDLVCSIHPQVALVGTFTAGQGGLDLCRRISQRSPDMAVILMTGAEESGELFEAIRSGASGYVSKQADSETIVQTIRRVVQGELPLQETLSSHPEVSRRILEEFQTMARNPRLDAVLSPISKREMELLRLLGQGRSNKEIAQILDITPQTVKNHISSILRKLDVNDRTQAVLAGLRYGWITLEEPSQESQVGGPLRARRN